MMIFDLSVDSVLVCYCTDVDENGGKAIHFEKGKLDAKGKAGKAAAAAAAAAAGGAPAPAAPVSGAPAKV
jgi:hypothetical protein